MMRFIDRHFHRIEDDVRVVHNINHSNSMDFLHFHDSYEIHFIISENQKFLIDDEVYLAPKGSVFMIEPDIPHMNVYEFNHWYERYTIHIKKKVLAELNIHEDFNLFELFTFDADEKNRHLKLHKEDVTIFERLLDKHIYNMKTEKYAASVFQKLSLSEILFFLLNFKKEGIYVQPINIEDVNYKLTKDIMQFITSNLNADLSLDIISDEFFRSKSTVNRIFKRFSGTTVNQYINSRRLYLASDLLEQGTPVFEVCNRSGFKDYNHFIKTFKKYYNETPKQYQLKKQCRTS